MKNVAIGLTVAGLLATGVCTGGALAGVDVDTEAFVKALDLVSGERLLADVAKLSSPEFNGRQTGSPEDFLSGLYLASQFQTLGLQPPRATFMTAHPAESIPTMTQTVTVTRIEDGSLLQCPLGDQTIRLRPGLDYLPVLDSPAVDATAPVVFVGYGLSDPDRGYDDYAGLDVRGKVVLFLRGKPEHYSRPVTHADKEQTARRNGAIAYLTATGPTQSAYEARRGISGRPSAYYGSAQDDQALPGAWIGTEVAERLLAGQGQEGRTLRELQEMLNRDPAPKSFATHSLVRMKWTSRRAPGTLYNVLFLLPGSDPTRQEEVVILGAHRDHFGRQAGLLFAGADDNASGTAVLLEVARVLVQSGLKPKRSILFLSFSGEEQGLLGSKLYVSQPVFPLQRTVAMINVDHVGVGNGRLTVGVTGFDQSAAAQAGQAAGLADKLDLFGFFPGGDHVPFKEAGVPTITIVTSGPHPHFHQPSDTADTVQPDLLQTVTRYVLTLTWHLADRKNGPTARGEGR
jgi:hypothetical protein